MREAAWELLTFQDIDKVFPHHSTVDQFFADEKFEAYRLLGAYVAEQTLKMKRLHKVESAKSKASAPEPDGKTKPQAPPRKPDKSALGIAAYVRQHPGTTVRDLKIALSRDDIYSELGPLVRSGAIVRTGSGEAAILRTSSSS